MSEGDIVRAAFALLNSVGLRVRHYPGSPLGKGDSVGSLDVGQIVQIHHKDNTLYVWVAGKACGAELSDPGFPEKFKKMADDLRKLLE